MDPSQIDSGAVMIGGLFLLLLLGMPIAFTLALCGIAGLVIARGWRASEFLLSSFPYSSTAELALIIIPLFRRKAPEGEFRGMWAWQEGGAWAWSTLLIAAGVFGWVPLRALAIFGAIAAATLVLNQIRTLVAHLWENDGEVLTVTGQFLDSVNVPPPGLLPELWAPVGLRYHALHHLLPGVPYHALAEAHRRLKDALPADSQYHGANYDSLPKLVANLVAGSARGAAA